MMTQSSERRGWVLSGSFNTASGKYYCNEAVQLQILPRYQVSIPQAVSTIAIRSLATISATYGSVSIPQAVSTIAIN